MFNGDGMVINYIYKGYILTAIFDKLSHYLSKAQNEGLKLIVENRRCILICNHLYVLHSYINYNCLIYSLNQYVYRNA